MFNRSEPKKRGGFLPLTIFRLFLSLAMLSIFAFGVYQAFRYFSGIDPIKIQPQSIIISLLTGEEASSLIFSIFNNNPPQKVLEVQQTLRELDNDGSNIQPQSSQFIPIENVPVNKPLLFKFAIVADSHKDSQNLKKALLMAEESGAKFIVGLGDYSEVGTKEELERAKVSTGVANIPFYSTAGDHDLWAARETGQSSILYYNQVFGAPNLAFGDSGIRFIIVFNSDYIEGVDETQMGWLEEELNKGLENFPKGTYVFLHETLYHPTSDRFMGSVSKNGEKKENPKILNQAKRIRQLLNGKNVKGVFAGDIHAFTKYSDPETGINMFTIGALTSERNTQSPRFALVDVFDDGSYNIEEREIK